jgi:hypothetical protein
VVVAERGEIGCGRRDRGDYREFKVPTSTNALINVMWPKQVRSEPGSDRFSPILYLLNTDLNPRFGPAISLNSGPNLGPVQIGSGSNLGSDPDRGITNLKAFVMGPEVS